MLVLGLISLHVMFQDALPLIEHIEFDPMFLVAFQQVFGRTLLCRNMENATSFAKNTNMDCITPDGSLCGWSEVAFIGLC